MIVCIIQARMNSTRLPGKILKPILGQPMLKHQIERVRQSKLIDEIVLATTDKKEDEAVAKLGQEAKIGVYRGSEEDVLDRFYQAAKIAKADIVIRLTGDCPLSDPEVIDETIKYFLKNQPRIDYASKPTDYPEGLDMEIFSFKSLERAWQEGKLPSEREHVTPYIYNHPEIFKTKSWQNDRADNSTMHWSVDTPADFEFVTKIFEELYLKNKFFGKDDCLKLLKEKPELLSINKGGTGYEGYAKSLKKDSEFQKKRKIYQKIIGFSPEVIAILSAGTIREICPDGVTRYRSTRVDEGDAFGTLFGEARVIAAAELAKYFPDTKVITTSRRLSNNPPTHASVLMEELEKLSIPRGRIILEENSTVALSQIEEAAKLIKKNKWQKIILVTNEYQIPRARAMYECFDKLSSPDEESKNIVASVKSGGVKIAFVGAEKILPYRDKSFAGIIKSMKKTDAYKKRLENEKRGTKMVLSGEYGRQPTKPEDKHERKI